MTATNIFDVIIIGGSYAGLSAAMALGRSLRRVLIIDSGTPCNRQTPHSQNFLTQDGKTPEEIAILAKSQVGHYETITFYDGWAVSALKTADGFEIATAAQEKFLAKKLILATGLKDTMPEIKGFSECWGISVIHCPYCHGYEHRHKNTAIIANGARAFHLASLVSNLTGNVTILTSGAADFDSEQLEKLEKNQIKIVETNISEIENKNGHIKQVIFTDGTSMAFDVAYAAIPFVQHSDIPHSLGCEFTEHGHIKIDSLQKTTVEGVFACGDNSAMMRSVANAVYTGNLAGAAVNGKLAEETFESVPHKTKVF